MYFKWNFMLLLTTAKTFTIIQVNLKDNLPLQCEWNEVIKIKPKRQIFFTNIPTIYHAINYNFSMEGNESPCECTRYWICLAWLTFYFIIITFSMALVLYVNHCQLFLFNNRQTFLKQTPIDMEWALFYFQFPLAVWHYTKNNLHTLSRLFKQKVFTKVSDSFRWLRWFPPSMHFSNSKQIMSTFH